MGDQGRSLCVLENRLLTTPGTLTHTSGLPPGKVQSVPGWPPTRAQMLEPLSFPVRCMGEKWAWKEKWEVLQNGDHQQE